MKIRRLIQWFSALGVLFGVTSTALAASFNEADTNGDNHLSLEEAKKAGLSDIVNNFKKLDSNQDGMLSKDELKANR